ncbi:MAG: M23 family metallopeptidase [Desulfovibrionaceae bacterium]
MGTLFRRLFLLLALLSILLCIFFIIDSTDFFSDKFREISTNTPVDSPAQPVTEHRPVAKIDVVDKDSAAQEPSLVPVVPTAKDVPALSPPPQKDTRITEEEAALLPDAALKASSPSAVAKGGPAPGSEESEDVIKGTINKGDTVAKLLGEVADNTIVQGYIDATRRVFPLTSFRTGQPYVMVCDVESGTVKRFEYEIDNKRRLVVEGEQPIARVEAIEYDTQLVRIEARIDSSLFQAVADIGESPTLAITVANLFGWEINFIRDLQENDSFSVLVEKNYREGKFKGYGRVLGATFTNKDKTYEAFLFHNGQSSQQHFNARGENLKKVLLQAPLSFTRLTSRFTHSRKHPIHGDNRPHLGVDYGAPTGTPVKAVGEGKVIVRNWVGGYGNQVALRHAAGLESMYSHLSGFARGMQKGTKVRQGQVIGYVGSTGQSTGPHLDFRLKQGGKFIDPTKAVNPRSAAVYKRYSAAFAERMRLVREFLNGTRALDSYSPESITAPVNASKEPEPQEEPVRKKSRRRH